MFVTRERIAEELDILRNVYATIVIIEHLPASCIFHIGIAHIVQLTWIVKKINTTEIGWCNCDLSVSQYY